MKKLFVLVLTASLFMACERAHHNTAGDTHDSSASHGFSGASDTINGSAPALGSSTSGSDTSTTGDTTDAPAVDHGKAKKNQ